MHFASFKTCLMSSAVRPIRNARGFSLTEFLTVLVLAGITMATAAMGYDYVQGHRLKAASQRLFGDLQRLRQEAMTQRTLPPAANSLGFGIRFSAGTGLNDADQYILFEFNDLDNDFTYDGVTEELLPVTAMDLPGSVTVKDTAGTLLDSGDVWIYDPLGIVRTSNWSSVAGKTIVIGRRGIPQQRCIVIDTVRIREGEWHDPKCL